MSNRQPMWLQTIIRCNQGIFAASAAATVEFALQVKSCDRSVDQRVA
jgi:hypothetical protein